MVSALSSVIVPVAVPLIVAASFAPVTVTVMIWLSVPKAVRTVSASRTSCPAVSACVATRLFASA